MSVFILEDINFTYSSREKLSASTNAFQNEGRIHIGGGAYSRMLIFIGMMLGDTNIDFSDIGI
jgi:hypothetical protein